MEAMLLDQLLTGRNIMLAGGVFVLMSVLRYPLKDFWDSRLGQRLLPILPVALGVAGAFAGLSDAHGWQDRLLVGLIAGWASAHTFKLGRTSLMGYGLPDADGDGIPDVLQQAAPNQAAPVAAPTNPAATAVDATKKE
jgi:hypothetical protein